MRTMIEFITIVVYQMNANKSIIFKINSFLIFCQIFKRLILCSIRMLAIRKV